MGYKYYILEEDNNAIVLASLPVRWNGITQRKLKLYVNFVSLGHYCIYQHCFCIGKNTTFVDDTSIISLNAAECNGMHQSSTNSHIEC
jgi:hypothetical protein